MICRLHAPPYTKNRKYEGWFIVGGKRLFRLLPYRELIKQDRERIGKGHFQGRGSWSFSVVSKQMIAYMGFVLPKSKHGSHRLYALWLPQDQNPGTFQIHLYSCLSLLHRMTLWLPSCLSIYCLQALPHSRACIPPASGYTFPSSSGSVSIASFSLRMATTSLLSFILLLFFFTDLFEHFGLKLRRLRYSQWFHHLIFSEVGCSNCCWKCGTC